MRKLNFKNTSAIFTGVFIVGLLVCIIPDGIVSGIALATLSLVTACVLLVLSKNKHGRCREGGILLLAFTLGIILGVVAKCTYYYPAESFYNAHSDSECELTVRIDDVASLGDGYANYDCSILYCNGDGVDSVLGIYPSVRVNNFGGDFASKGDTVRFTANVTLPEAEATDGFREDMYLKSRHIFMSCDYSGTFELLHSEGTGAFGRIRERILHGITRYVGNGVGDETLIARCMLLGDKTGITKRLKNIFRSAGISHILSVSGLHLSVLFMAVSAVLGLKKRNPRRRFATAEAVSCALIFTYMALSGFTPSIMRAGLMLITMNVHSAVIFHIVKFGAKKPNERFNSLSSLFVAGAVICVVSPYSVFDVGMQLSFMSTLGILLSAYVLGGYIDRVRSLPLRAVVGSLVITFSAVSFTLPICVYNFGTLSLVCAVSNILVSPLAMPLLMMLLVLGLLSLLPQVSFVVGVCTIIGNICEGLCALCIAAARLTSSWEFSVLISKESVFVTVRFIIFTALALYGAFYCRAKLLKVAFTSVMCLYFIVLAVSLAVTVLEYNRPKVNFCTVKQIPYMCYSVRDTRIIPDDGSALRSLSTVSKCFGEELYGTENVYFVIPNGDTDFESVYFNIVYLDEKRGIDTVLTPSEPAFQRAFGSTEAYTEFIDKIEAHGFDVSFYADSFTADGIDFVTELSKERSRFATDLLCVIFGGEYDAEYASASAENCRDCIYFCTKASEGESGLYSGGANLYITSPLYKKIEGAMQIPVRGPKALQ
ncbi:MAG: ComEC/Rec2 family competence protein [Clostridia bacterium]|nr:ComEC/Rec2 family competence protein [Clostridia bacterium]